MFEGEMKDGYREGLYHFYRTDGSLEASMRYSHDKREGKQTLYDLDGKTITCIRRFNNDELEGVTTVYSPEGSIVKELLFSKGNLVRATEYYPSVKIKQITEFADGHKQGLRITYDESGQVTSKSELQSRKRDWSSGQEHIDRSADPGI